MQPEHKHAIKLVLEELKNIEIEKKIVEVYPDYQEGLESLVIGGYPLEDFILFVKRTISQIDALLDSKLFAILPYQYHFHNEFGAGNLKDDLMGLCRYINKGQFEVHNININRLVYYLIQNGLWEKEQALDTNTESQIVENLKSKITLMIEQANQLANINKTLFQDLSKEKDSLASFISKLFKN